jgi:hypothetical protein
MRQTVLLSWWMALTTQEKRGAQALAAKLDDTPEMQKLFDVLQQYSRGNAGLPVAEPLFRKLYGPNKPYSDPLLRKTISRAVDWIETYLIGQSLEPSRKALLLQQIATERFLPKLVSHYSVNQLDPSASIALDQLRLQYAADSLLHKKHDQEAWQRIQDMELIQFCLNRMRLACQTAENQRKYSDLQADIVLIGLFPLTDKHTESHAVLYQAWRLSYALLYEKGDRPAFLGLVALLQAGPCSNDFLQDRELLQLAINFCSRLYNQGDRSLLDQQLALFRIGLDRRLLYDQGHINGYTFTNMITIGLINRSHTWVREVLDEFGRQVAPAQRSGINAFNEARLCYALQDYNRSLVLLQQAVYNDLLLNLSAKTVQMKVYYSLKEWSALDSHLEAMRQFIRRHKELSYHRDNFLNLISMLSKCLKNTTAVKRAALRVEIAAQTHIAEKEWLLEILG